MPQHRGRKHQQRWGFAPGSAADLARPAAPQSTASSHTPDPTPRNAPIDFCWRRHRCNIGASAPGAQPSFLAAQLALTLWIASSYTSQGKQTNPEGSMSVYPSRRSGSASKPGGPAMPLGGIPAGSRGSAAAPPRGPSVSVALPAQAAPGAAEAASCHSWLLTSRKCSPRAQSCSDAHPGASGLSLPG